MVMNNNNGNNTNNDDGSDNDSVSSLCDEHLLHIKTLFEYGFEHEWDIVQVSGTARLFYIII